MAVGCGQQRRQPVGLARADGHRAGGRTQDQVLHAARRDQPAPADHDQLGGGDCHFAHQVRGDQHGPALGGQRLEQVTDPDDPLRVQAVDRLVEQQHARIAQQRRRDPQPLPHTEGEAAGALTGNPVQPDQTQHLVHPRPGDAVGRRHRQQVCACGPPGVHGTGFQQCPDLPQRRREVDIPLAVDQCPTRRRPVQAQQQPHRGRLTCPVRSEETGDHTGPDHETQIVHRRRGPVMLTQTVGLDHRTTPSTRELSSAIPRTVDNQVLQTASVTAKSQLARRSQRTADSGAADARPDERPWPERSTSRPSARASAT